MRGASLCASGSQLWTGAQPILAARPASRSTNATSVESPGQRVRGGAQRVPVERVETVVSEVRLADREHEDSEQRDRQPERGQHEVLPAGLERVAPAAEGRRAAPRRRSSPRRAATRRRGCRRAGRRAAQPRRGTAPRSRGSASAPQSTSCGRSFAGRRARRRRCRGRRPRSPRAAVRWRHPARYHWPRSAGRPPRASTVAARASATTAVGSARGEREQVRLARGAREQREQHPGERQRWHHGDEDRHEVSHAGLEAARCRRFRARCGSRCANAAATGTISARSNSAPSSIT